MTPRYEGHPLSGAVPGGRSSTTSDLPSSEDPASVAASVTASEPGPPPSLAEVQAAIDAAAAAMKPVLLRRLRDAWEGEE